MQQPGLVPELDVADLDRSRAWYCGVIGFRVLYERPAERFAYLVLDDVHVMLQEAAGPGRRFRTAPLEPPFGRGVNFETAVSDVDDLSRRVLASGAALVVPLEDRTYEVESGAVVNRQFVVADPDGYLWRFCTEAEVSPRPGTST